MKLEGFNGDAIIRHFRDKLRAILGIRYTILMTYRNGHVVLKDLDKRAPSLYVIFKRDFYMSFSKEFKSFCENNPLIVKDIVGESINKESLHKAIAHDCDFVVFIHPSDIMMAPPMLIKKYCEKNNLIRTQKRINSYLAYDNTESINSEQESTYSFPITILTPFNNFEEYIKKLVY